MAEGLANHFLTGYKAFSAGTEKTHVNPQAIKVMTEIGIDITDQFSKTLELYIENQFDTVVTVCDTAKESCPFFPNATNLIHKSFNDPSDKRGDPDEKLEAFRKTREMIKTWLLDYFPLNP